MAGISITLDDLPDIKKSGIEFNIPTAGTEATLTKILESMREGNILNDTGICGKRYTFEKAVPFAGNDGAITPGKLTIEVNYGKNEFTGKVESAIISVHKENQDIGNSKKEHFVQVATVDFKNLEKSWFSPRMLVPSALNNNLIAVDGLKLNKNGETIRETAKTGTRELARN